MKQRFAEKMNYFDTTVKPAKSRMEIMELLEDFGIDESEVVSGKVSDIPAWLIRFKWDGKSYRFIFRPLPCERPGYIRSYSGHRRTNAEQAVYQMGRIAVYYVKAILTAAEFDPAVMFSFLELPGVAAKGKLPPVVSEMTVEHLIQQSDMMPLLTIVEGE